MNSSILLQTDNEKEIKLDTICKIKCIKHLFTIEFNYLYIVTDKIRKYKLSNNTLLLELDIKNKVDFISVINNEIYCSGDGRLTKNMSENILLEDTVLGLSKVKDMLGIQYSSRLVLYDKNLIKKEEYKCSTYFYDEGLFILAYKSLLQIKCNSVLEVYLEEDITCVTADVLFTKVLCGTISGKIYQINMDGSLNKVLDYHQSSVKSIKLSVCNKYIYSVDINGELLVWDSVVIDRAMIGDIKNIEIYL